MYRFNLLITGLLLMLLGTVVSACDDPAPNGGDNDAGADSDTDTDTDADTDTDTDSDTDTDTDSGTDTETHTDTETGSDPVVIDPDDITLHGRCPLDNAIGLFEASVTEKYSMVSGKVNNGMVPAQVPDPWMEDGGCRLLRKRSLICDPLCESGFTCDVDGSCIPFPVGQDVGTVRVHGLNKYVEMEPRGEGNNYFDTLVPHPVFDPNRGIRMSTTDGYIGAIELFGIGFPPLTLLDEKWVIVEENPLVVNWEPPARESHTRIELMLTIDQHGTSPLSLYCDFPDTGQGEIPASLIDEMLQMGVSGYPNGTLTRNTADSLTQDVGCIEFLITAPVPGNVDVSGFTPCKDDDDCPEGQHCNIPIETCEDDPAPN